MIIKPNILEEISRLASTDGWRGERDDIKGMCFDFDAAILQVIAIKDEQFSIRYDEDGEIYISIGFPVRVKNPQYLERIFYKIWAKVAFQYSLIKTEMTDTEVIYRFFTITDNLGYQGSVTFRGKHVQGFLDRFRKRKQKS